MIETALYNEGIMSMRVTFKNIHSESMVDDKGRLFMRGREISLVYFRTGYDDKQY